MGTNYGNAVELKTPVKNSHSSKLAYPDAANVFARGQIWSVDYPAIFPNVEVGIFTKVRPSLIVSIDVANYYAPVVTVLPISGVVRDRLPTHIKFKNTYGEENEIHVENILTVSVTCLSRYYGAVHHAVLDRVDAAIITHLTSMMADIKDVQTFLQTFELSVETLKKHKSSMQYSNAEVDAFAEHLKNRFVAAFKRADIKTEFEKVVDLQPTLDSGAAVADKKGQSKPTGGRRAKRKKPNAKQDTTIAALAASEEKIRPKTKWTEDTALEFWEYVGERKFKNFSEEERSVLASKWNIYTTKDFSNRKYFIQNKFK